MMRLEAVSGQRNQEITCFDLGAGDYVHLCDLAVAFRTNGCFHFHRFEHGQFLPGHDLIARLHGHHDHQARKHCADLFRVFGICLEPSHIHTLQRAISDGHFAWLAVKLEEYASRAVWVGFADREELDDQSFAGLDVDGDFLAGNHPVEEHRRREHTDIGKLPLVIG